MIEQNLPEAIENNDLEYLNVRTTPEVFNKAIRYAKIIAPNCGITYDDLLYTMKAKELPYTAKEVQDSEVWDNAGEPEREAFQQLNPECDISKMETIAKEVKDRQLRLSNFPVRFTEVLYVLSFDDEGKPGWQINQIREIVREGLWGPDDLDIDLEKHRQMLRNTEYFILTELFFRVFIKPKEAYSNAFFFNLLVSLLKPTVPILNIMMPGNPDIPINSLMKDLTTA